MRIPEHEVHSVFHINSQMRHPGTYLLRNTNDLRAIWFVWLIHIAGQCLICKQECASILLLFLSSYAERIYRPLLTHVLLNLIHALKFAAIDLRKAAQDKPPGQTLQSTFGSIGPFG